VIATSKTSRDDRKVTMKNENNLKALRHSTEHVLTQSMLKLYPQIKMAMGPATEDGFYFDFDPMDVKISEDDFPKIEAEMSKIIKADLPITFEKTTLENARKLFKDNEYKLDWIKQIEEEKAEPTLYKTGSEFIDLCAGPHLESTGKIGAFKLLSIAGAYWHGDEKNKMLVRIYGTAFPTQKELDDYIDRLEDAKKRDHRVIGQNLNLFVFTDLVGKGLPLFTEKGSIIRRELERFIVDEEIKRGYHHVYTPDLAKVDLYRKSGHFPYYKDTMYPIMKIDDEELILRPMTCPHHFQLYASRPHSYRELPIRYAELAKQFRYEKSGELTGLMRVRAFCLADAHIIARKDQAVDEINSVLDLIEFAATALGLEKGDDYRYRLSLGDRSDDNKKYYKDDDAWDFAENVLRQVLIKRKAPMFEAAGEAAFYGPKIDIQMKNVSGQENTAFTVQYDFVMPKRFNLTYTDSDGKDKEPIVIHRSSIGAIERVMAFLIEKYAGAFPTWLSPVQAIVIPISEKHLEYATSVFTLLKEANLRVSLDDKNETTSNKIRNAETEKIPYIVVVGDREAAAGNVSVRGRGNKNLGVMPVSDLISEIKTVIEKKA
jgi:threonyl-tRNA synthetase